MAQDCMCSTKFHDECANVVQGQMPPDPDTQIDLYAGLEAEPPGVLPGTPEWLVSCLHPHTWIP